MNNTIGTVLEFNDNKYLLVGIKFENIDNKYTKEYLVVPFPFGFVDEKSIRVISEKDMNVIQSGNDSEVAKSFSTYIDMIERVAECEDGDTIEKLFEELYEK